MSTGLEVGAVPDELVVTTSDGDRVRLTRRQLTHAATIMRIGGRTDGVGRDGVTVALMAALTESGLRMLSNASASPGSAALPHDGDGGDHDSLGLFQMRPSTGWGSVAELMDPAYQARAFFGGASGPNHGSPRGLLDIPAWQSLPKATAAQAVEVSAHPDRYAQLGTSSGSDHRRPHAIGRSRIAGAGDRPSRLPAPDRHLGQDERVRHARPPDHRSPQAAHRARPRRPQRDTHPGRGGWTRHVRWACRRLREPDPDRAHRQRPAGGLRVRAHVRRRHPRPRRRQGHRRSAHRRRGHGGLLDRTAPALRDPPRRGECRPGRPRAVARVARGGRLDGGEAASDPGCGDEAIAGPARPLDPARRTPGRTPIAWSTTPPPTGRSPSGPPTCSPKSGRSFPATGWSCWSPRAGPSEHPLGRACDGTFGNSIGTAATGSALDLGWKATNWLKANAQTLGVEYLIWQGRIWSVARSSEGWRPYDGGGMHDPGGVTGGHYDHLHFTVAG